MKNAGLLLMLWLLFAFATAAARAGDPGYDIWFAGRIVSLDAQRGTVLIARGPMETAAPAIQLCTMPRRLLRRLTSGMEVEAEADTRARPWRILHLRIFAIKAVHKPATIVAGSFHQRSNPLRNAVTAA